MYTIFFSSHNVVSTSDNRVAVYLSLRHFNATFQECKSFDRQGVFMISALHLHDAKDVVSLIWSLYTPKFLSLEEVCV